MAITMITWLVAIPLLGFANGLRTMTPIAVLCWFGYLGYLPVQHDWAFWTTKLAAAIIFTLLALGELIGDKLPKTPSRIAPGPLAARVVFGGLVGAIAATALQGSILEGIVLGALGAVLGAFGGYHIRHSIVEGTGWPDWIPAITEDGIAILTSIFAMGIITG